MAPGATAPTRRLLPPFFLFRVCLSPLPSVGVDRQGLTAFLVDEAARRFPQAITFHFNANPDIDLQQRHVRFVSEGSNLQSGSPLELPYDLLVGADGAGSTVRAALEHNIQDVQVRHTAASYSVETLSVSNSLSS